jgi:hypothetical protein
MNVSAKDVGAAFARILAHGKQVLSAVIYRPGKANFQNYEATFVRLDKNISILKVGAITGDATWVEPVAASVCSLCCSLCCRNKDIVRMFCM